MQQDHEYAVLGGINRARVGRYIFAAAAALSTVLLAALASLNVLLQRLGWPEVPSGLASLLAVATLYLALYWLFNRFAWRVPFVSNLLRVPDIAGIWRCEGKALNPDTSLKQYWEAKITIVQTFDKIRLRLQSPQSGSNSLAAALHWDDIDGYKLLYHYRNDPRIGEAELQPHHGFAEIVFSKDRKTASGEYFNGRGRMTFGTMQLTRETP